jgi:hypothetical protein
MADDQEGAIAPADDMRAAIGAAFDEVQSAEAKAPEPVKTESQPSLEKTAEPVRDEKGRFAAKDDQPAAGEPQKPAKEPVAAQAEPQPKAPVKEAELPPVEGSQEQQPASPHKPPRGWSVASKAAFDTLPESVKADIAKREDEVANGFAKYAEYKPLEQYVEMARQNGKSLPDVLAAYQSAETTLQNDTVNGLVQLSRMYNAHPVELIAGIARTYGINLAALAGQAQGAPNQNGAAQPQAFDPRLASHLQALDQRYKSLEQKIRDQERGQEEAEQSSVNGEIAEFGSNPEHKYFDNVRPMMGQLIRTGAADNLQDAYEKACWANPDIRKLFVDEQFSKREAEAKAKAEKVKATAKSLPHGSPHPGAARTAGNSNASVRDDIAAAFEEHAA